MGATAAACRGRGNRARLVCLAGAVVFLSVVPSVRADPDTAPGSAPADPAGQASAPGNSENAPGHDAVGPGSSANAPGHDPQGPGSSENAPGHQADQGASIEQQAGASASAGQRGVGNSHVSIRVDEPGNGTPVAQENRVEAQADAAASATADAPGATTIEQQVHADSGATQADVGNSAVSVRVGSPGDDGAVSQTNTAAAGASAAGSHEGAETTAAASATQDGVANTSVSVRVFSPGDDGPTTQRNGASAGANAGGNGGADATATQDAVRNTSVSIRVDSPGAAPAVSQGSEATATADAGSESAVAVTSDSLDTALVVVVHGDDLDRPAVGGLEIWEWNWIWQRDESGSLDAFVGTEVGSWNWTWDGAAANGSGHGTVTSRPAGADDVTLVGGTWQWSWQWDRAGIDGWTWQWNWAQSPACATCIWIWNWSWSWTGQPPAGTSGATGTSGPAAGAQVNSARAEADATAVAHAGQAATQGGVGNGMQYAGQLIEVSQTVEAIAAAVQSDVASISQGEPVGQANSVASEATATLGAAVTQDVEQVLLASERASVDQWSGQQADVAQVGRAAATASQGGAVLTRPGAHAAAGKAHASGSAAVEQLAAQAGLVDGGSLSQSVAQLTIVEQSSDAVAAVAQGGTTRSKVRGGIAVAGASAGGLALVDQAAEQRAVRTGGTGVQDSAQLAYVAQDAVAHAATTQQAGAAALPLASSDAVAQNRAWIVQAAAQASSGSDDDLQEILQQSAVAQSATAVSISNGGIAGSAVVVNCAVTQQGAAQSIGAGPAGVADTDLTIFCFPPAAQAPSPAPAPSGGGATETIATEAPAAIVGVAPEEEGPTLFQGRGPVVTSAQADHAARRSASSATFRHEAPVTGQPVAEISAPHSTQARLDTRPGSIAGDGDAGTEPPLPPAGGPLAWASALAVAASGAGSSGVAAILMALALVAPLLRRAPEGSVVRRPTDVLVPVDVPV